MSAFLNFLQNIWHRFAMPSSGRLVPGVSAAPQPPANGWQPFGLRRGERERGKDGRGKRKCVTPWWRTLKSNGELNPKFPGGIASQSARLRAEGLTIEPGTGRKPPRVKDFDQHFAKL